MSASALVDALRDERAALRTKLDFIEELLELYGETRAPTKAEVAAAARAAAASKKEPPKLPVGARRARPAELKIEWPGLTENQAAVLNAIIRMKTEGAKLTSRAIAERADVPQGSMGYALEQLGDKGYLTRDPETGEISVHPPANGPHVTAGMSEDGVG